MEFQFTYILLDLAREPAQPDRNDYQTLVVRSRSDEPFGQYSRLQQGSLKGGFLTIRQKLRGNTKTLIQIICFRKYDDLEFLYLKMILEKIGEKQTFRIF